MKLFGKSHQERLKNKRDSGFGEPRRRGFVDKSAELCPGEFESLVKIKLYEKFRCSKNGRKLLSESRNPFGDSDYLSACFDDYEKEKYEAYEVLREKGRKWFMKHY
ncbi:hypothetical protein HN604_00095 [archaeon]|jgi:hypothetical protein|nr:hypothetical protein [archaeon]MBT6182495.1 hypothetical protein [archaeon]MBT6606421.1 hypothetical protein [archaeon]MBT7251410.1 hypothetical protein [archaeon]MBT7660465.1 hypothetical protein [archaeon]